MPLTNSNVLTSQTAALTSDVPLNSLGLFFVGAIVGTLQTGLWLVTATVTVVDTAGAAVFPIILQDDAGLNIDSGVIFTTAANQIATVTLAGRYKALTGNRFVRIQAADNTSVNGKILFNGSTFSKDGVITAVRIST